MTPLAGLLIALLAALFAPTRRAVLASTLIPMAAATAVQSWYLGSGRGSNPASTIDAVSYWIVQVLIVAIVLGVALGVFHRRVRRAERTGRSLVRPGFSGRRGAEALAAGTLALSGLLVVGALGLSHLHRHHGQGKGDIPWTGVVGIILGALILIALVIAMVRESRTSRTSHTPGRDPSLVRSRTVAAAATPTAAPVAAGQDRRHTSSTASRRIP